VESSPAAVVVTPPSATEKAFRSGLWAGRAEAVVVAGGAVAAYDAISKYLSDEDDDDDEAVYKEENSATRALMRELVAEFDATDPLVGAIQVPASGRYAGDSAEDDDGDQHVVTTLSFGKDGSVRGWGEDGVDGKYTVDGRWSSGADTTGGSRVAWIETYDDGFEVALRGQVRKSDGAILGMWASSRGVSGSVKMQRPKT